MSFWETFFGGLLGISLVVFFVIFSFPFLAKAMVFRRKWKKEGMPLNDMETTQPEKEI